jgi:RNA polymerase sigma-70 factor (ECF subfamily)
MIVLLVRGGGFVKEVKVPRTSVAAGILQPSHVNPGFGWRLDMEMEKIRETRLCCTESPTMDSPSVELLARWRTGDDQAARHLFDRFTERLLAMAHKRLAEKLARRLDAEDVVQSAYRSFFRGAREGRFVIERSGDLWRLLAAITLNKLKHQIQKHSAGKRALKREEVPTGDKDNSVVHGGGYSREPAPDEAAALADMVESLLRHLHPVQREMLELRLQGSTLEEIAAQTHRSERTVRRLLEQIRQQLEQQYVAEQT